MQTHTSRLEAAVTVTPSPGSVPVELRFASRAEIREHIAACALLIDQLPDDGQPVPAVRACDHDRAGGPHLTLGEITGPATHRELESLLNFANRYCPDAIQRALRAYPPAGHEPAPDADGTPCDSVLCDSVLPLKHGGELKCTQEVYGEGPSHYGSHRATFKGRVYRWLGSGVDARSEEGALIAPFDLRAEPAQVAS